MHGSNLACTVCLTETESFEDNQEHLLHCTQLTKDLDLRDVQYTDIFDCTEKQVKIAQIFKKISQLRKTILKTSSIHGSQAHPC